MIRITIELWPGGNVWNRQTLGTLDIINDGTGTREEGNYLIRTNGKQWSLRGFKRDEGFFVLVKKALNMIV